jgi:phage terminase small subunit
MTGRRPEPTALKLLEGVLSSRINHAEPAIPVEAPECPKHLDALAKKEFARSSADLTTSLGSPSHS